MPYINKEFLAALQNTDALRKFTPSSERDEALNALLLADTADLLEAAVLAHNNFWEKIDIKLQNLVKSSSWGSGNSLDISQTEALKSMRKAAAEQRVKFALASAKPDVLVSLLTTGFTDNGKELRDYIESQQTHLGLNLTGLPGWTPTTNENLLTKDSLVRVRTEAATQLLIKLIDKRDITNPKLFHDLVNAPTVGDFQTAAKDLLKAGGITPPQGKTLEELTAALTLDSKTQVVAAVAVVEFERQLQQFKSSVTDAQLLDPSMRDILKEANKENFTTNLAAHANLKEDPQNPYKTTIAGLPKDKKEALATSYQQSLCEQYVKARVLTVNKAINDANFVAALNDTTATNLKASLKAFIGGGNDDGVIDLAVTDTNLATFKVALTKNAINIIGAGGTPAHLTSLKELETAANKDLASFRKELAKKIPGVASFDFVQEKDLPELRKALGAQIGAFARNDRAAQFEAEVKKSRLDAGPGKPVTHKELVAVFKQLPDAKQLEILKDIDKTKKHELLISAKTKEELEYYLGTKNAEGGPLQLTQLVEENKRAALFKQIYNPEIAKVLMGIEPPIVPTPAMINTINTALLAATYKDTNVSSGAPFKVVVDAISTACFNRAGNAADDYFYKAFGLTDESANTFTDGGAIATAIEQYRTQSKPLLDALADATPYNPSNLNSGLSPVQKKFVEILARVNGTHTLTTQIGGTAYTMNDKPGIKKIYLALGNSSNTHEFLDKLIPNASGDPVKLKMKEELSREFTPEEYEQLKAMRVEFLMAGTPAQKETIIKEIKEDLERVQDSSPTIEKHKGYLKNLQEDLTSLPNLFSGANEVKAKNKANEMKGKYEALGKQCDTIIEHLASTQHKLQVYLDQIPLPIAPGPNQEELTKLHEELTSEKTKIKTQLKFYQGLKKQINGEDGALANIEKIMKGKATVLVEKATISYSIIDIGQEKTAPIQANTTPTTGNTSGSVNTDPDATTYKVQEIPPKGKVLGINLTHYKEGQPGQPPVKESEARVTVNYHPEGKATSTGSKPISVSLVATSSTRIPKEYMAEQSMEAAKHLLKDWDGKSPIRLKGVHGKDTELQYLWTAVCLLGEHHPKFSRDKIEFRGTSSWRPEKSKELNMLGRYTDTSIYKTVFKGSASGLVEATVNEFKSMVDPKKRDQVDKGVVSATSLFRKQMDQGRPHDIATLTDRDLGKQAPRSPSLSLGGDED
ncbi:interaptin [Legionella cherrii]|uniref:Interaptin n=1 Tax=Legionella cherrii TaxID=28084 RepID=A0A0W0SGI6_9GAMM|nr:hypothetical protein [Legionella cherrii]KTC82568.1 interaptin [Legionella cherrii]